MTEFIGRTGSKRVYSYPVTPRGASASGAGFARNFAIGPASPQDVFTTGTAITWQAVDVPGTNPEDVPITPRSTGNIRVSGVVTVENASVNSDSVTVQLKVNGVLFTFPAPKSSTGQSGEGGFIAIPYLVVFKGLSIGVPVVTQLIVTAEADGEITLTTGNSTLNVEEVQNATG